MPSSTQAAEHLRLLVETGLLLARAHSVDVILQAALDAARMLSGAAFGVFSFHTPGAGGHPRELHKLSGEGADQLAALLTPSSAQPFASRPIRSADITRDPAFAGIPFAANDGVLPLRSVLSIPVTSRSGEPLGLLLFGHPQPGIFTPQSESLVATVAAQAAVALDNVRLQQVFDAIADQDLSQHRRAELALAESSRRLRQALDAGALGTWTWNRVTDMLDLDERAAALLFAEPHVPTSRSELRRRIVVDDDLPNTPADLHDVLRNGGSYSAEYRVEGPEKAQRWIAARGLATFDPAHEFTGMVGTVQDITVRKTQEAVLRQSEKLAATGRLAATIAHEINNPLEAVTNLIYLCRTDPSAPAGIQRLLDTADDELARVTQIAQQTLGFYRDTTRPGEINLSAMLHGIVELFSRKLQFKHLTCRTLIAPGLRVFGLQGEIRQVFSNLLVNAIDASENTELVIRACARSARSQPGVSCLVIDRGSGMPAAIREHLFSPFITSKHSLGTGLGLWVTRGIVEKHGGTIHYRTRTEPPTGTVFRVFLPMQAPNVEAFNSAPQRFLH